MHSGVIIPVKHTAGNAQLQDVWDNAELSAGPLPGTICLNMLWNCTGFWQPCGPDQYASRCRPWGETILLLLTRGYSFQTMIALVKWEHKKLILNKAPERRGDAGAVEVAKCSYTSLNCEKNKKPWSNWMLLTCRWMFSKEGLEICKEKKKIKGARSSFGEERSSLTNVYT